jgi:hypothetical protein
MRTGWPNMLRQTCGIANAPLAPELGGLHCGAAAEAAASPKRAFAFMAADAAALSCSFFDACSFSSARVAARFSATMLLRRSRFDTGATGAVPSALGAMGAGTGCFAISAGAAATATTASSDEDKSSSAATF